MNQSEAVSDIIVGLFLVSVTCQWALVLLYRASTYLFLNHCAMYSKTIKSKLNIVKIVKTIRDGQ